MWVDGWVNIRHDVTCTVGADRASWTLPALCSGKGGGGPTDGCNVEILQPVVAVPKQRAWLPQRPRASLGVRAVLLAGKLGLVIWFQLRGVGQPPVQQPLPLLRLPDGCFQDMQC